MPTKKTANKKRDDAVLAAEIGAGVVAAGAALAAGYYFYGAKNAKKHRAAASKWATGLKNDVVKQAKKLKKIDQKSIATLVDTAAAAYATGRVDSVQLKAAARELKANWKKIQEDLAPKKAVAKKAAKKTAAKKART